MEVTRLHSNIPLHHSNKQHVDNGVPRQQASRTKSSFVGLVEGGRCVSHLAISVHCRQDILSRKKSFLLLSNNDRGSDRPIKPNHSDLDPPVG